MQLTERERLIELLRKCDSNFELTCPLSSGIETDCISAMCEYNLGGGKCDYTSRRANYLLDNGIIVLPCIVNNWNSAVSSEDTTYILGDFCWGTEKDWLRILNRLQGQKVLIRGNHDLKKMSKSLRSKFVDVKDYKEIKDNGRYVILSHYPIMTYKHSYDTNTYMLHGHTHQTKEQEYIDKWTKELRDNVSADIICNKGQIYNVGCMCSYMNYFPRTLDEILENANID